MVNVIPCDHTFISRGSGCTYSEHQLPLECTYQHSTNLPSLTVIRKIGKSSDAFVIASRPLMLLLFKDWSVLIEFEYLNTIRTLSFYNATHVMLKLREIDQFGENMLLAKRFTKRELFYNSRTSEETHPLVAIWKRVVDGDRVIFLISRQIEFNLAYFHSTIRLITIDCSTYDSACRAHWFNLCMREIESGTHANE